MIFLPCLNWAKRGVVVRTITLNHVLLAALLWSMPWISNAAGLGKLVVLSSLGQPFKAEIDLVSGQDDPAALKPRIASRDAYNKSDFQYNPILSDLRLSIHRRPGGQAYIEVTSSRLVHEPYLQLMIELQWNSTGIIRGYTAFIDPPDFAHPPVESMPVVAAESRRIPEGIPAPVRQKTAAGAPEKTTVSGGGAAPRSNGSGACANAAAHSGASLSMECLRALEEQATALKLAIVKLNERIVLMDKAVAGMQRLLKAYLEAPAAQKKPDTGPVALKPESGTTGTAPKAGVSATATPEAPKTALSETPKVEAPAKKPPAPARPEDMKPTIALPPEFSGITDLVDNPLYLAAGGTVILLGGLVFWMRRRNSSRRTSSEDLLNKLLARDPDRDDVQIKLLEIYAARKDNLRFNIVAAKLHALTGGQGEAWLKVAETGHALDPGNPLYLTGGAESVVAKPPADDDFHPDPEADKPRL